MKVYFISGLGANEKAFQFLDLSFCEPIFISWIKPLPHETLPEYAARLKENIPEPNAVIVGISFGGMLVTEMAKRDPNIKGIIISSNKTSKEFPNYLRVWKHLPVYKWASPSLVKSLGRLTRKIVGPKGKAQQKIFTDILNETDPKFTTWAIDAILHWKNSEVPPNVIHIHGSSDRLLPSRMVSADHMIPKGSHLMIMDHATELSKLLKEIIVPENVNPL